MAKVCDKEGCDNPCFAKLFCKWHQYLRTDKKPKDKKRYKRLNPIADKRKEELAIYRPKRDKYMAEHPICEWEGCNKLANDLHHINGRTGKMVYNEEYFMAICRPHHTEIDLKPSEARENGYLI